jgi:hypothetical protein
MNPLQQSIIVGIAVICLWLILGLIAWCSADRPTRDARRRIERSRQRSRDVIEKSWLDNAREDQRP